MDTRLIDELGGSIPPQATKLNNMKRLIYDLYYAGEISMDIAIRLLDKWSYGRDKRKY